VQLNPDGTTVVAVKIAEIAGEYRYRTDQYSSPVWI